MNEQYGCKTIRGVNMLCKKCYSTIFFFTNNKKKRNSFTKKLDYRYNIYFETNGFVLAVIETNNF